MYDTVSEFPQLFDIPCSFSLQVKGSDWLGDQDAIHYMCREAPRSVIEVRPSPLTRGQPPNRFSPYSWNTLACPSPEPRKERYTNVHLVVNL